MEPTDKKTARAVGAKFYFTGRLCPSGHLSKRLTSDGACHECRLAIARSASARKRQSPAFREALALYQRRKRLEKHGDAYKRRVTRAAELAAMSRPDRLNEKIRLRREHYTANKEKASLQSAAWRSLNLGKVKEQARARSKKYGPAVANERNARRRARLLQATPTWADLSAILAVYAKAECLTKSTGVSHHVDHIVPLRGKHVCGLHIAGNLQVLTADANHRKYNKLSQELPPSSILQLSNSA